MAWSTRQLAELARTTVKAVRHYHDIGLLDEPERAANGYKQYRVSHLVRLLQIKRLSELGVPLARIAEVERADEDSDQAIRALDAELEATIERLTRIRAELAAVLHHRAPPEVPPGFAPFSETLSDTRRSLLLVFSTIFDEETMEDFRQALVNAESTDDEFERLPADADDAVVERLAQRMVPVIRASREKHPHLVDPTANSPHDPKLAESAIAHALVELYNTAQLRVLKRANEILTGDADDAPGADRSGTAR